MKNWFRILEQKCVYNGVSKGLYELDNFVKFMKSHFGDAEHISKDCYDDDKKDYHYFLWPGLGRTKISYKHYNFRVNDQNWESRAEVHIFGLVEKVEGMRIRISTEALKYTEKKQK